MTIDGKDQKTMLTDYVIELAKRSGMQETFYIHEELEKFAALVRAEALEEAAKMLEAGVLGHGECAAAIRELK